MQILFQVLYGARGLTCYVYIGGLSLQCWGSTDNGSEQFVTCLGGPQWVRNRADHPKSSGGGWHWRNFC